MGKVCSVCKIEKDESRFYKRYKKGQYYQLRADCKNCCTSRKAKWLEKLPSEKIEEVKLRKNNHLNDKNRTTKESCVKYKGSKCRACGYDRCIDALEFHHRNPNEKEFAIKSFKRYNHMDLLYKELDKCDLLCANCHREIHNAINRNVSEVK